MLKRKVAAAVLMGMLGLAAMGFQFASSHAAWTAVSARPIFLAVPVVPPIGPPP